MSDPTITCPSCRKEIKLNESLAAPLLESTRREFEQKLDAAKAEIADRTAALKQQEDQIAAAKLTLDEEVRIKTAQERTKIAAEESAKAKRAASVDLDQKAREVADLNEILKQREKQLTEATKAQADLIRQKRELDDQKRDFELNALKEKEAAQKSMADQLEKDRGKIVADEAARVRKLLDVELQSRDQKLAEAKHLAESQELKLVEAQKAQAESLRKQRELDEAKRDLDVTVEKRVNEAVSTNLTATYEKAKREVEDAINLKLAEKDLTIKAMQDRIEELKRTSEQGSQQAQGEVLELLLEQQLGAKFPHDLLEPVAKGEHGGDLLHRVQLPGGTRCGSILWETKRTKHWSDGWLVKLREDQQAAKAETAVIVSYALPKGVEAFEHIDGIWVIHPRSVLPMATALRHALIEVHTTRQSGLGQLTKMEQIYAYLTGPRFRLRMEAIIESYDEMREDLAKERKMILKQWQKRETQIERLLTAATGMYGEMQGIAGASLPELKGAGLLEGEVAEKPI